MDTLFSFWPWIIQASVNWQHRGAYYFSRQTLAEANKSASKYLQTQSLYVPPCYVLLTWSRISSIVDQTKFYLYVSSVTTKSGLWSELRTCSSGFCLPLKVCCRAEKPPSLSVCCSRRLEIKRGGKLTCLICWACSLYTVCSSEHGNCNQIEVKIGCSSSPPGDGTRRMSAKLLMERR